MRRLTAQQRRDTIVMDIIRDKNGWPVKMTPEQFDGKDVSKTTHKFSTDTASNRPATCEVCGMLFMDMISGGDIECTGQLVVTPRTIECITPDGPIISVGFIPTYRKLRAVEFDAHGNIACEIHYVYDVKEPDS